MPTAERAYRPASPKNLHHQVRGAVHYLRMVHEILGGVDEADQLHAVSLSKSCIRKGSPFLSPSRTFGAHYRSPTVAMSSRTGNTSPRLLLPNHQLLCHLRRVCSLMSLGRISGRTHWFPSCRAAKGSRLVEQLILSPPGAGPSSLLIVVSFKAELPPDLLVVLPEAGRVTANRARGIRKLHRYSGHPHHPLSRMLGRLPEPGCSEMRIFQQRLE